ncbi:MAG: YfhO family protein [Rhodothermales bacterium]
MASHKKKKSTAGAASKSSPVTPAAGSLAGPFQRPLYQHAMAIGLLVALSFTFFGAIHFSGKSLIAYDTVSWRAMAQSMISYEEATGDEALWATNAFAGMPGYLISTPEGAPQVDDIPRLLRGVIWPSSHLIVMLVGAYLLAFFLTGSVWSSVFGAVAYGLTTYMPVILAAGHNSKFIALAFAPWLVLAFAYALKRPGLLGGLLFAIALAVNLRAGHVQITYYAVWVIGIWWVVEGVSALRSADRAGFLKSTGWLALGGVLGILMVAHPYLAISEYKNYTIRGAEVGGEPGTMDWTYAMGWSQGVGELLTLLVAHAFGGSAAYWGPKGSTGGPHYVGGLVIALAILAIWRYRDRKVLALGIAALVMTLFSLGEHFSLLNRLMFDHFPMFDAFRVPETWLSIVALVLAALAAIGLHGVMTEETDATPIWKTPAFIVFGSVILFLVVLLGGKASLFSFERPGEYEMAVQQIASGNNVSPSDPRVVQAARQYLTNASQERRDMFGEDAVRSLIFLVLGMGAIVLVRRGTIPAGVGAFLFAALVVVDLWGVDRRYLNSEILVDAASSQDQIQTYDFDRYLIDQVAQAGGPGHFRVLSLEGRHPSVTARPSFHYESLGGYHGAKLRLYQDYLEHLLFDPSTGIPNPNALDLLGVKYVVAGSPVPGLQPVYTGDQTGYRVFEKVDVEPRAHFVGEVEVMQDYQQIWDRLRSASFDVGKTAIVETPLDLAPAPIDSNAVARVDLEVFSPREIRWSVETDAPRLLVVSEVYYPAGWTATIDGVEAPIEKVDYLIRGVVVPAGAHTVEMRFDPSSVRLGYTLSLIATLLTYGGVLALLGLGYVRTRR